MARNSLLCADVPLRNYSLTHPMTIWRHAVTGRGHYHFLIIIVVITFCPLLCVGVYYSFIEVMTLFSSVSKELSNIVIRR